MTTTTKEVAEKLGNERTIEVQKSWGKGTINLTLEEFQQKWQENHQLYLLRDYTELESMNNELDEIKRLIDNACAQLLAP